MTPKKHRQRAGFTGKAVLGASLLALLPAFAPAFIHAEETSVLDLAGLSLEELGDIRITSASPRAQSLSSTPASIFVITTEDIQRSGATTIPEILRLAPNLQVARIDSVQYAISARGFNNAVGNKLLVLVDGRTLYTPLFSGVFWEMQDIHIDSIERVEVISGPGAILWGANAVNGVINIITRSSAENPGTMVAVDAGSQGSGLSVSSSRALSPATSLRVYGKARQWEPHDFRNGTSALDRWNRAQAGFRADWSGEGQTLTLQGDIYDGQSQHRGDFLGLTIPAVEVTGANLMANWSRQLAPDSQLQVRAYWSSNEREETVIFSSQEELFNLDFQHSLSSGAHRIDWGAGVRTGRDHVTPGLFTTLLPARRQLQWENVFLQDEIRLTDRLRATVGARLDWNDYSGREFLPNLRLAWQISDNHLLWTSLSRAVRAPSRFDRDAYLPLVPPYIVAGGPDFESEVARVIAIGYRGQVSDRLNYSITLFHHDWDRLRSGTSLPLPTYLTNNITGEVAGVEAWGNWQVRPDWRLSAGFSTLDKELRFKHGTTDTVGVNNPTLHNDPDYHWRLSSRHNLRDNLHFDIQLHGVAELESEPVPAYTEVTARLAWRAAPNVEFSLTGHNLLDQVHTEFGAPAAQVEIERSVVLGLKWSP